MQEKIKLIVTKLSLQSSKQQRSGSLGSRSLSASTCMYGASLNAAGTSNTHACAECAAPASAPGAAPNALRGPTIQKAASCKAGRLIQPAYLLVSQGQHSPESTNGYTHPHSLLIPHGQTHPPGHWANAMGTCTHGLLTHSPQRPRAPSGLGLRAAWRTQRHQLRTFLGSNSSFCTRCPSLEQREHAMQPRSSAAWRVRVCSSVCSCV